MWADNSQTHRRRDQTSQVREEKQMGCAGGVNSKQRCDRAKGRGKVSRRTGFAHLDAEFLEILTSERLSRGRKECPSLSAARAIGYVVDENRVVDAIALQEGVRIAT